MKLHIIDGPDKGDVLIDRDDLLLGDVFFIAPSRQKYVIYESENGLLKAKMLGGKKRAG